LLPCGDDDDGEDVAFEDEEDVAVLPPLVAAAAYSACISSVHWVTFVLSILLSLARPSA
jgi:hypothetical protein